MNSEATSRKQIVKGIAKKRKHRCHDRDPFAEPLVESEAGPTADSEQGGHETTKTKSQEQIVKENARQGILDARKRGHRRK